jgi:hypothetical protein
MLATFSLHATRYGSLREAADEADSVVLAAVTAASSYYGDDGEIYTDVTVQVGSRVKDRRNRMPGTLTFTVRGGEVGDHRVAFSETPSFQPGEPVLLFLDAGRRPLLKYTVTADAVPELGRPALDVIDEVSEGGPMRESEREGARRFLRGLTSATKVRAATACYAMIGAKWQPASAAFSIGSTIPSTWTPALTAAAQAWSAAGTPFRFTIGDSTNTLSLGAVAGSASILAETRISYSPSTGAIRSFRMVFSNTKTWSESGEPGKFDVQSIATHELGHALGLDHPSDASCADETMWASAGSGETKKRTLESGDKAGLSALYLGVAPPTPTPTPTPNPAPVLTSLSTFPSAPRANIRFYLVGRGEGFAAGAQFVISGGACPAAGCIVSGGSLAVLSASTLYGVVRLPAGDYQVVVRAGADGAVSSPRSLTVR